MGIPFDDAQKKKGWKILITTRSLQVCTAMECEWKIILDVFSKDEAWDLFKNKANLCNEDSALYDVAKKVAEHCKQLPLAISVMGKALRGKKTLTEWNVALGRLKDTLMKIVEAEKEVDYKEKNIYACLKMSYNCLEKNSKVCFLLCSLFPEDYDIPFEGLTRCVVGWQQYQGADQSLRAARDEVFVAIKELKDSSLLLDGERKEHVKMHDLVRDVAIQIASQEFGFMVKAGIGLTEWPKVTESLEGCTTISLMGNKLTELPEGLVCPQLKVLFLELGAVVEVPYKFFEGMKAIEVLSLKGGCLSLQFLEFTANLQSLELIGCTKCTDLTSLSKLQRLKILIFNECSIDELPDEIGELKELRLLDLTWCKKLRRIPVNLIGRLKKLEELLIGNCSFNEWDVGGNASLTELNSLSNLSVLVLNILNAKCIPRDFVFPNLDKYGIKLGMGYGSKYTTSRSIFFNAISVTSLNMKTFELLFPTVSEFHLEGVEGMKNIITYTDQMEHEQKQGFLQELEFIIVERRGDISILFPEKLWRALKTLRRVEIRWCNELEAVFELGETEVDEESNDEKVLLLSSLTTLYLWWSPKLKCIWRGMTQHVSLKSLTIVKLYFVNRIKFIFTPSLARSLQQLQTLSVRDCEELEHIISGKDEEEIIAQSLCFPKLRTLRIEYCPKLEDVFPVSVASTLLNLNEIIISWCGSLNQVFGSGEGDTRGGDGMIVFPQLRKLRLVKCGNLNFCGPKNFAELSSLQHLEIVGHDKLSDILEMLRGLTNLEEVTVNDCKVDVQERRCLWKFGKLKCLRVMELSCCRNLRYIFPPSISPSLVQLKSLKISRCDELEEIIAWDVEDGNNQVLAESHLQSLCFPNLSEIEVRYCNNLKRIFSITMAAGLPQLQKLILKEAPQLREVFGQDGKVTDANVEIEVPKLLELSLEGLPSLVCFTPTTNKFIFPRLKRLEVKDCPKMTITFAVAANDATSSKPECVINLRNLSITGCGVHEIIQVGSSVINSGGGHELSLLSLETLTLRPLPDLRCICKGLVLKNLTALEVTDCNKLRHILPSSMIASLVLLKTLKISSCSELEHIFVKDGDETDQILSRSHLQSLWFPTLLEIEIRKCNKLKSLFPLIITAEFPQLKYLKVSEAPQLMEIFGWDEKASPINIEKEMEAPNLQGLRLKHLPGIVSSSNGSYNFLFPCLVLLEVYKCPKLATKFATTPNGSMSAQSKISQVAEDSNSGCSVPTSTYRMWTRYGGWETKEEVD